MAEKKPEGMLIDYGFCTGCHSCEVSCKQRFGLDSDRFGIKINTHGAWKNEDGTWELNYIPAPTEICDLCADRREAGKKPLCQLHCQALVIEVGPLEDLVKKMGDHKKQVLYNFTNDEAPRKALF